MAQALPKGNAGKACREALNVAGIGEEGEVQVAWGEALMAPDAYRRG